MATTTQSRKQKGRLFQQLIVKKLLELFPQLESDDCQNRSMGAGGEDVMLSPAARRLAPISIECKAQESVSIWNAFAQCKANAGKYQPVLFIKRNRTQPLAVIDLDYFLTLLKGKTNED